MVERWLIRRASEAATNKNQSTKAASAANIPVKPSKSAQPLQ